ncbi:MAG: TonB-dependent receptor [Pelomonas sp.]|nr:TonB-dependent receptor [Roseateles sp.]
MKKPCISRARRVAALTPLSLAAALLFQGPALAQQAAPAAAKDPAAANGDVVSLDTVTVTARRREETLKDVPVAVTALTAATLETRNIQDLGDLQGEVPSLTIYAARGSNTTITAYLRGVGQSDPLWGVDPGVGIYFDDVYVARPQGALLDVFDVQRIEVLRGPQGTLYGKNTVGGAIKYVSKPLEDRTDGSISFTYGSFAQLDAKAQVNIASPDGEVRARAAVATLHHDGYGRDLADGSPVSNQDTDAGRLTVGYYPKALPLTVVVSTDETFDNSNMRGFQRMAVNPLDPAKTPASTSRYDIDSGMPNKNYTDAGGNSLTATWNIDEAWSAKYITAMRDSSTSTAIDFDGLPAKIADVSALYHDLSRSNELQLSYDGQASNGVMGLYFFNGEAGGTVFNNFLNLLFGDTGGTVYTRSKAAYADWSWKLSADWGASAGLRYTQESKHAVVLNQSYSDATFTTVTGVSAAFDKTRSVSNTSPKLGVDYKLSTTTNLYASWSRGFKSGGYNIRANTAAVPQSSKPFDDETLDSFEIGSKSSFDGGHFELNTALFDNKYKNVQLSVFSSYTMPNGQQGFFGDFTNAGKATVRGLELEYAWRPDSVWVVSGNVSVLDAKYDEYLSRGVNIASQERFADTPHTTGAVDVEARTGTPWGGTLRSHLGVSYRSQVYPTTDLSPVIAQGAYALVNAGMVWERNKHWTFALQGSNLTNKAYRTDGYNIPALGILDGYYGPPRTVTVTAGYKF